jgi:hypothetical protein
VRIVRSGGKSRVVPYNWMIERTRSME